MLAVAESDVKTLSNLISVLPAHIKSVPDAVATMLVARDLGIPFMSSVGDLMVINGTVGMTSKLMLALVRKAGHRIEVSASSTVGRVVCHRKYDDEWVQVGDFTFTQEDAERANLWAKQTYQLYPQDMLANKAVARAVRFCFSDVLMGYSFQEMSEFNEVDVDLDLAPIDILVESPDRVEDAASLNDGGRTVDEAVEALEDAGIEVEVVDE